MNGFRRGQINKGLVIALGVLAAAALIFFGARAFTGEDTTRDIPDATTTVVALVSEKTGERISMTSAELAKLETQGDFYKNPKTGEFDLTIDRTGEKKGVKSGVFRP